MLSLILRLALFGNNYVRSSVKSAERYRNLRKQNESCPEVGGVSYRSGVYKMHMVRMVETPDKLTNVRV
jgi:hypothetical protein